MPIILPNTIARVLVALRSFLAADLSFFRLIFSSFFATLFWGSFFPTWNTELIDLTTVSFFPFWWWLFESSAATVICCSPFDDEDWSFLTSTSTGFFIVVETVLSPVLLQEVRMMDGTVCDDVGRTLFSSGRFIWNMHLGNTIISFAWMQWFLHFSDWLLLFRHTI